MDVLFSTQILLGESLKKWEVASHRCLGCSLCLVYRQGASQCFVLTSFGFILKSTNPCQVQYLPISLCLAIIKDVCCWAPTLCLSSLALPQFCVWWWAVLSRDQRLSSSKAKTLLQAIAQCPQTCSPTIQREPTIVPILRTSQTAFWTVVSVLILHKQTQMAFLQCFPELETG